MKKTISAMVISTIVGIAIGLLVSPKKQELTPLKLANYHTLPYKIELIKAYDKYMGRCENLLDYIADYYPDFEDTIVESDIYYNYEYERDRVNYLLDMEDNDNTLEDYYATFKTIEE